MGGPVENKVLDQSLLVPLIRLHQHLELLRNFLQLLQPLVLLCHPNIGVESDTGHLAIKTFVRLGVNAVSSQWAAHLPFLKVTARLDKK